MVQKCMNISDKKFKEVMTILNFPHFRKDIS